jgi:hypothetical protein
MLDPDATKDDASDHEAIDDDPTEDADQLPAWKQPLQTLSGIPGVQLRVEWVVSLADTANPYIAQWLKQHGQLVSHLSVPVLLIKDRLKLSDISEAAASCKSFNLNFSHYSDQVVDLTDLAPVAGSLKHFTCEPIMSGCGSLRGLSARNSSSQLIVLHFSLEEYGSEQLCESLANLSSLQQLMILRADASGDPSPLSALMGLSNLYLKASGRLKQMVQPPSASAACSPSAHCSSCRCCIWILVHVLPRHSRAWLGSAA